MRTRGHRNERLMDCDDETLRSMVRDHASALPLHVREVQGRIVHLLEVLPLHVFPDAGGARRSGRNWEAKHSQTALVGSLDALEASRELCVRDPSWTREAVRMGLV